MSVHDKKFSNETEFNLLLDNDDKKMNRSKLTSYRFFYPDYPETGSIHIKEITVEELTHIFESMKI